MQSDTKMPLIATRNIRLCQLRKSSNGKKEFFLLSLERISCLKTFSVPTDGITRNWKWTCSPNSLRLFLLPFFISSKFVFFSLVFSGIHRDLCAAAFHFIIGAAASVAVWMKPCLYVDIWCALHRFRITVFFLLSFCFDAFSFMQKWRGKNQIWGSRWK